MTSSSGEINNKHLADRSFVGLFRADDSLEVSESSQLKYLLCYNNFHRRVGEILFTNDATALLPLPTSIQLRKHAGVKSITGPYELRYVWHACSEKEYEVKGRSKPFFIRPGKCTYTTFRCASQSRGKYDARVRWGGWGTRPPTPPHSIIHSPIH